MSKTSENKQPIVYTVGHSNRSIAEFGEILTAHGIKTLVDVRSIPKSAHNPQFGKSRLASSLKKLKISYVHLARLGGLRRAKKDSKNLGWRNASFRGYADYMATQEFKKGMVELIKIARKRKTAIMCAEAVPWRCHRSLIADALIVKKWSVENITGKSRAQRHKLTPFLKMRGRTLTYPIPGGLFE